eukprot:4259133-Alexandrium_andersonii.AAC.1
MPCRHRRSRMPKDRCRPRGGAWHWISVCGPAGEPGIRHVRVVPLHKEFAEPPATVAFAAPA